MSYLRNVTRTLYLFVSTFKSTINVISKLTFFQSQRRLLTFPSTQDSRLKVSFAMLSSNDAFSIIYVITDYPLVIISERGSSPQLRVTTGIVVQTAGNTNVKTIECFFCFASILIYVSVLFVNIYLLCSVFWNKYMYLFHLRDNLFLRQLTTYRILLNTKMLTVILSTGFLLW